VHLTQRRKVVEKFFWRFYIVFYHSCGHILTLGETRVMKLDIQLYFSLEASPNMSQPHPPRLLGLPAPDTMPVFRVTRLCALYWACAPDAASPHALPRRLCLYCACHTVLRRNWRSAPATALPVLTTVYASLTAGHGQPRAGGHLSLRKHHCTSCQFAVCGHRCSQHNSHWEL
jgi:hypothetical protein